MQAQAHATATGNIMQLAQLLGWSRFTVRDKLKLHGLRSGAAGEPESASSTPNA